MKALNNHYVGLALGAMLGLYHAVWSILVMLGLAEGLLDFIYGIHFLSNPFMVTEFNLTRAVILVVVTTVVGYVFGWVFAWIWNWLHGKKLS